MIEQIQTYEDAERIYKELYGPLPILKIHKNASKRTIASLEASHKLSIIARVLNEDWTPDWKDKSYGKYLPFGISIHNNSLNVFGMNNPLIYHSQKEPSFKTGSLAAYAGTTFKELYIQLRQGMLISILDKDDSIYGILSSKHQIIHGPYIRFKYPIISR